MYKVYRKQIDTYKYIVAYTISAQKFQLKAFHYEHYKLSKLCAIFHLNATTLYLHNVVILIQITYFLFVFRVNAACNRSKCSDSFIFTLYICALWSNIKVSPHAKQKRANKIHCAHNVCTPRFNLISCFRSL